jgi:hypothetical protein
MSSYRTTVVQDIESEDLKMLYNLYSNVQERGLELNTFKLPFKFFKNILVNKSWEIIKLELIPTEENNVDSVKLVGVAFAYRGRTEYVGGMIGLDYSFNREFGIYRQLIYQFIEQGRSIGYDHFDFGFCAGIEKKKFGAVGTPKVAYIQAKDNFNFEALLTNSLGKEVKNEPALTH